MTPQLEDAPTGAKEAIKGDENVLKGERNTINCDKEAPKSNEDEIKRDD